MTVVETAYAAGSVDPSGPVLIEESYTTRGPRRAKSLAEEDWFQSDDDRYKDLREIGSVDEVELRVRAVRDAMLLLASLSRTLC